MAASPPKSINVNISFKTVVQTVFFLLLLWALYLLRDLILVILVSVVIASAVEPMTVWLQKYRLPRVVAVLLIYLLILGIFFTAVPFLMFSMVGDLSALVSSLSERFGDFLPEAESGLLPLPSSFSGFLAEGGSFGNLFYNFQDTLLKLQSGFLGTAGIVFGGLMSFILIIVLSFYLAVQEQGVANFLKLVLPVQYETYISSLWQRSQRKIGLWFQGQLVLAVLVGIMVYLGLIILGVKYALALGLIAAILELIPIFGPVLAAIPAVLVALTDGWTMVLLVIGFYIIIQQFENHLLHPLVVKKIIGVPPIIVIIALVVGAKLAGFLGLVMAAPLAAVVMEILDDWERRKVRAVV